MRIIAGSARGRALFSPKGRDTRPTLDRVRESLFSILAPLIPEARVLDLFAGTGALALESLSRGARRAVLVDRDRQAKAAIERNIEALGFSEQAAFYFCDWRAAVRRLSDEDARFDLIFLDPPYRMPGADEVLAALAGSCLPASGARIVYEHGRDETPGAPGLAAVDERRYGDTVITFFALADAKGEERT